jgi:hypothetical protein
VRQFSSIDAASAAVGPPSKIDRFPFDLCVQGLEFSGIYQDGWLSDHAVLTLYAASAGMAVLRGLFPAGIGLDSVEVTLTVGSSPSVVKRIMPGPFVIAAPAEAGWVHIDIGFSGVGRLPAGDGRPAVARVTSVAVDTDPDQAVAPPELSGGSPPRILGPLALDASGVFADGWIASAGEIVVHLKRPATIILRGMIPGGIGLEDQEIAVDGDVGAPIRKRLAPGEFGLEIPLEAGRSRIRLAFSRTAILPDGDGRNVAALLRSMAGGSKPSLAMQRVNRMVAAGWAALRKRV